MAHAMRSRIITNPAYSGEQVLGAVLVESSLYRDIGGMPSGDYLWEKKGIVPFVKIDHGLQKEKDGVQLMKEWESEDSSPALSAFTAARRGFFGTKMRAVIHSNNEEGIQKLVDQQFQWAVRCTVHGLVPILQPEVNTEAPDKADIEETLLETLKDNLNSLGSDDKVILELTPPEKANQYHSLIGNPHLVRVVLQSKGMSSQAVYEKLNGNARIIESFTHAYLQGSHEQLIESTNRVFHLDDLFEASVRAPAIAE